MVLANCDGVVDIVGTVMDCDPPMDVAFIELELFGMLEVALMVIVTFCEVASKKVLLVVFKA